MTQRLKDLTEIVAKAIDEFCKKPENPTPIMGITDKTLRQQGMNADAITIDSVAQDKKIVMLIHDDKPDSISIALGNKNGDIFSSTEYALADVTEEYLIKIMNDSFIKESSE